MNEIVLQPLMFAITALSPVISEETLSLHHGKHLATYVANVNNLKAGTEFEKMPLDEIVKKSHGMLFNNAAQVWNHNFYFEALSASPKSEPTGDLLKAINEDFGSLADFKKTFSAASVSLFGSGWAWLVKNRQGRLEILQESNAGTPLTKGLTPLLTFDVWEHAYYVDYRNRRAEHVEALWKLIDWSVVEARWSK